LHNRGNGLEYRVQIGKKHSLERTMTGGLVRRTGSRSPWLVFGGAALVALLLYLPTLQYEFVWDDGVMILNNPVLDRTSPIELLTSGYCSNPDVELDEGYMAYYRPLTNLSLYVDRKVWGLRPAGYHLTNVIINTSVVFLMCLLLWELFGSVWLAGLGGLLVGIHPAMNCAVTFIANRTYLLALLFLLVGSYALLRGQRRRGPIWPVLFGGSLLFSALALEASLVFAAIAAAWLLGNRTRYRRLPVWIAATATPVAAYFLLRLGIARVPFAGSVLHWAVTDPLRVINAFGQQLQLLLFPFNQKVIYVAAKPFTGFSAYTVLGLLLLGLPLYAAIRLGRSATGDRNAGSAASSPRPKRSSRPRLEPGRLGWYGYAWVVLFLLPFAHLVFLGPAGRMLYLAAPGVLILLAALYQARRHRRLTTRVAYGALLLYTAALAVQTLGRNPIWRNELSLSRAMVQEAPASAGGHLNYGSALSNAGRKEEAIEQFRMAAKLNPAFVEAHVSLAFALIDQGDLPGAIREFREVVKLRPASPRAHNDLGVTLVRIGQLDSAIVEYKEALRLDPNSELTLNNLGYAYLASEDFTQAIAHFKAALRLKPDFAAARSNLAAAYWAAGMPDSAALVEGGK
jgi:Flp pilus assembly protein TadD